MHLYGRRCKIFNLLKPSGLPVEEDIEDDEDETESEEETEEAAEVEDAEEKDAEEEDAEEEDAEEAADGKARSQAGSKRFFLVVNPLPLHRRSRNKRQMKQVGKDLHLECCRQQAGLCGEASFLQD